MFNNASWKTTASGILSGIGGLLVLVPQTTIPGVILCVIGNVLTGIFARDNDKTSQQVSAGK